MKKDLQILTIGPSGQARIYKSVRAVARVLSGDGSERSRTTILNRLNQEGGGFVGRVYVADGTSFIRPTK